MMKYRRGLVVGRFQPFHLGHIHLIKKSLQLCEKLIIGIGSSNVSDQNNIFTYEERKTMIDLFVLEERLKKRIIKIVPIPDVPDDNEWFRIVCERAGKVDVFFGNNEWVNDIFKSSGIPTHTISYLDRANLNGKKIRELMKNNKKWDDRVANYIQKVIQSS